MNRAPRPSLLLTTFLAALLLTGCATHHRADHNTDHGALTTNPAPGAIVYEYLAGQTHVGAASAVRVAEGRWLTTHHARPPEAQTISASDLGSSVTTRAIARIISHPIVHDASTPNSTQHALSANDWMLALVSETPANAARPIARLAIVETPPPPPPAPGDSVLLVGPRFVPIEGAHSTQGPWSTHTVHAYQGTVARMPRWARDHAGTRIQRGDHRLVAFRIPGSPETDGISGGPVLDHEGRVVALFLGRVRRGFLGLTFDTIYLGRVIDDDMLTPAP